MTETLTGDGLTADKFNLLPQPVALPATCSSCGSPRGPVVSWGLRVERFGAVYLCVDCAKTAGLLLGMTPKEKLEEISHTYESLIDNLVAERDELARRVEDQNIGQDLDARVRNAVTSALTDPDVLAALKESLTPPPEPVRKPESAPEDNVPVFRI